MKPILATCRLCALIVIFFIIEFNPVRADYFVIPIGQKPKRTVLVSPKSTPVASGTALLNALAKITTASETNPYMILIEPGIYDLQDQSLEMKPHVHVQGAGQEATVITSTVEAGDYVLAPQGTVNMVGNTSLRDLTIQNLAANSTNHGIALSVLTGGVSQAIVADVTARALGANQDNYAISLVGWWEGIIEITMQNVNALAENAINYNCGLRNGHDSSVTLLGGVFVGRGGEMADGIWTARDPDGYPNHLVAKDVEALGENSVNNTGLWNTEGTARLVGGSFIGRGGSKNYAIVNFHNPSYDLIVSLNMENVVALAEEGSSTNTCLLNRYAELVAKGGRLTGVGGNEAVAISNSGSEAELIVDDVKALAYGASTSNTGMINRGEAIGQIHGAVITARGGTNARGLYLLDNDPYAAGTLKVSGTLVEALDGAVNSALVIESGAADAVHTSLEAADNLILGSGGVVNLRQTYLDGGVINSTGGTVSCLAVTDASTFYQNICP